MNIFMTVEVASRELESRALLAAYATQHGFDVFLGRKKETIDRALVSAPGIFLSQWGLHRNFRELYKKLKALGHVIICLDEEGLVTLGFEHYVITKVDTQCVALVDKVLLWGNSQERAFKSKFPAYSSKFEAVGNPRDDILHDRFECLFFNEKNNDDNRGLAPITFVSSFGFANHVMGGELYFKKSIKNGVFFNEHVRSIFTDYFYFQTKNFKKFVDLAKASANLFPERIIIYRFHPSENRENLIQELAEYRNIRFSFGGSLIPLLRKSVIVVHNYCHAGIEAQILGKKTIAFRPERNPEIEDERVYSYSKSISEEHEALSIIEKHQLSIEQNNSDIKQIPSADFIYRADDELASERITIIFKKFSEIGFRKRGRYLMIAKARLVAMVKSFRTVKDHYIDQKSEGLNYKAVRNIIDKISLVEPRAGGHIYIKEISPYVFKLTQSRK
jgi:surface carbohydrate biosynthesis protein